MQGISEAGYRGTDIAPVATDLDDNSYPADPGVVADAWYCVVAIPKPVEKTKGGIILAASTQELDTFVPQFGKILAVGPLFYNRVDMVNIPEELKPKVGSLVHFKEYNGWKFTRKNAEGGHDIYMVLKDADIAFHLKPGMKASDYGRFA